MAEVCKDDDLSQFELCYINARLVPRGVRSPGLPAAAATATFSQSDSPLISVVVYLHFVSLSSDNELLSLQNKKGRNKSAAVQFVKKDWGEFIYLFMYLLLLWLKILNKTLQKSK